MTTPALPRLGVNIDHLATLRQLRGTRYPDLLEAAKYVERAGGHQITVHLREDRRHIQDADVKQLRAGIRLPMNLEMAATDEMARIATRISPEWSCIVPERRQEVTTEGGLDLVKGAKRIARVIEKLKKSGIRVSLFVEPTSKAVRLSRELGADAIELHTGKYCLAAQKGRSKGELERIATSAKLARKLGLACHAGHGFDYENVRPVAELRDDAGDPSIEEFNIGHSIVCRAALVGMERAVREMLSSIYAP